MTKRETRPWSIDQFFKDFNNADIDFTAIALNELETYLKTHDLIDQDVQTMNLIFIPGIIQRITDDRPYISNPIFRLAVMFARAVPVQSIEFLLNKLLEIGSEPDCNIRTQLLSVLRQILVDAPSLSTERQTTIVEILFPKAEVNIRSPSSPPLVTEFYINILSYLIENLGTLISADDYLAVFELIQKLAKTDKSELITSIANLTKIYATKCPLEPYKEDCEDSPLKQLIDYLFQLEELQNAMTILSAIVIYKPTICGPFFEMLIDCFLEQIQAEEETQKAALDEGDDQNTNHYIQMIIEYLSSVSALVNAFPEMVLTIDKENPDKGLLDAILNLPFAYVNYGSTEAQSEEKNEDEPEFTFDNDASDFEDDDDDEIRNNIVSDDTWKVRKTAISLILTLMKRFPEQFLEYLTYTEEGYCNLSVVNTLLYDTENGVQLDTFNLIESILRIYGKKINNKYYASWFETAVTQLKATKKAILSPLLDTLSRFLIYKVTIKSHTIIKSLKSTPSLISDNSVNSVIKYTLTIIRTQNDNDDIINPIVSIYSKIIGMNQVKTTIPALQASAHLFYYARGKENEKIDSLANKIMRRIKKGGEIMLQSISTISIFVISFPNTELSKKALDKIIENLDNEVGGKPASGAIALIAACTTNIFPSGYPQKIVSKVSTQLNSVDISTVYRSLWVLKIFLDKKIINELDKQLADGLFGVINSGYNERQLLAIKIFNYVPKLAIPFLSKFSGILLSSQITEETVKEIALLILGCSKISPKDVEKFISKLISDAQKIKQFKIVSKAATVIGIVGGYDQSFGNSLLESFGKSLESNITIFNILCIGELASNIDITSRKSLVDKLFTLMRSQDRGTFLSASESLGLASVSSKSILERILSNAQDDSSRLTSYLFAFISFMKKVLSTKRENEFNSYYPQISQFLIHNANAQTETSLTISEALCCMIKINNSFIKEIINISKKNPNGVSAPVLIRSIGLFIETEKSDVVEDTINETMKLISSENPILSENCMYCLKVALQQNPTLVSKLNYFEVACNNVKMDGSHIVSEYYGAQQVTKDIGFQLRLNAIETVVLYFKLQPSALNTKLLLDATLESIKDSNAEVQIRGMSLFCTLATSKVTRSYINEKVASIAQKVQELESSVSSSTSQPLKDAFTRVIIYIHKLMGKNKNVEIQKIYKKIKESPKAKSMAQDYELATDNSREQNVNLTGKGSMSYILMEKFHEEAAHIFAN
ncbi:hypothetical protein GPJ56_001237 [Histomonas meleagridis]|uniref:uncharacterized protein n=1 Tax=Histomonas meleagridis TaxID=135588 RepID=UPI00355AC54C|nr:hypothetical protein GPJ56_001237 [Histomonas meleagridis]KAH0797633.1 hypothetical protein GO595_009262 [Histomonas meleagridis]